MSDDPFEVRLRDNYELLEDEFKENLKRQKMLEEKVNEIFSDGIVINYTIVQNILHYYSLCLKPQLKNWN